MPKSPPLALHLCAFAPLRETNHFLNQQRLLLSKAKETNRKDAKYTKVRGLKRVFAITTNS